LILPPPKPDSHLSSETPISKFSYHHLPQVWRDGVAGTFSHLYFHVVFSTKHRAPMLTPEYTQRLYPYLGGLLRKENAGLRAVGGIEDHVHLLISTRPVHAIADLVRIIKSRSSEWMHETFPAARDFAWQSGYGAFTVSKSQMDKVVRYIENQAQHHQKEDYLTELKSLLDAHEIDYREEYLAD
jgi:putative transposase